MYMAIDEIPLDEWGGNPLQDTVSIKRKILKNGSVDVFTKHYFHKMFENFIGEEVEVKYEVKNYSRVWVVLPNFQVVEAFPKITESVKAFLISDEQVDESIDLIEAKHEAKKVIREMQLALDDALELRGIWIAINDPLALEGDKQKLRQRFMEIEVRIRAANVTATEYLKKQ